VEKTRNRSAVLTIKFIFSQSLKTIVTVGNIITRLKALGSSENLTGLEYFGITAKKSFRVPTPVLKQFARDLKKQLVIDTPWHRSFGKPAFTTPVR